IETVKVAGLRSLFISSEVTLLSSKVIIHSLNSLESETKLKYSNRKGSSKPCIKEPRRFQRSKNLQRSAT
ncbi:hypothetical protein JTE90_004366, partial [Oedothorax gibbosus]